MICDVSKHQGTINWEKLAPKLDFCMIKASGKTKDPKYDYNASECMRLGVPFHAYHFMYCTSESAAKTEAKLFSDSVGKTTPLFWVIDCEHDWGVAKSKARTIAETFEAELRRLRGNDIRVGLYIGQEWYSVWKLDYDRYSYIWIPGYGEKNKPPYPHDIWQYTDKGSLPGISGDVDLDKLSGRKPMEFFTQGMTPTKTEDKEETTMQNYDKYILSTGTHYISNSGKDENNAYKGGQAGDQSGHEWELKAWYSRPWTVVLRWPDPEVGLLIARLSCAAALNNKIGYDQYQRTTYWKQLEAAGYDPSKITVACEEDCTAGVTANAKAAGYLKNIPSLKSLPTSVYSGSMKSTFVKAGFKALTDSKYLTGPKYLLPGDVLLYEGHHAAANVTYGSKVRPASGEVPETPIVTPDPEPEKESDGVLKKGDSGSAVKALQKALLEWYPGCLPKYGADGKFGTETSNALKAFQTEKGLEATGVYDEKTRAALTGTEPKPAEETPVEEPTQPETPAEEPAEKTETAYILVKGGSVNVRKAPGTDGTKVLGVAHRGDQLPYRSETRDVDETPWYAVTFREKDGWISGKYGKLVK